MRLLTALGQDVDIMVGENPRHQAHGRLRVRARSSGDSVGATGEAWEALR